MPNLPKFNIPQALKALKMGKHTFTFIDLFAGIGGFRVALEELGGRCVFSSEWNKFSRITYKANFGEEPEGDITKIDAAEIPDHDILAAGFPCQPFSIAGVFLINHEEYLTMMGLKEIPSFQTLSRRASDLDPLPSDSFPCSLE